MGGKDKHGKKEEKKHKDDNSGVFPHTSTSNHQINVVEKKYLLDIYFKLFPQFKGRIGKSGNI